MTGIIFKGLSTNVLKTYCKLRLDLPQQVGSIVFDNHYISNAKYRLQHSIGAIHGIATTPTLANTGNAGI